MSNPTPADNITDLLVSLVPDGHKRLARRLFHRFPRSATFSNFVVQYESRIRKELKPQRSIEDCWDVLCELEFAAFTAKFVTGFQYQVPTSLGKKIDYLLGFENVGDVGVEIKRIREVATPIIRNEEGLDEINYTQKESFKFTDHIMAAMTQLMPGIPNVIYIKVDSTTHELYDAGYAINSIIRRARLQEPEFLEKHKLNSITEFQVRYYRMNLLVVRTNWGPSISKDGTNFNQNRIWVNEDAALELPHSIVDVFRRGEMWG